jgi:AraC-like DNA-binding protein
MRQICDLCGSGLTGVFLANSPKDEWVLARPLAILAEVADAKCVDWSALLSAYGLSNTDMDDPVYRLNTRTIISIFADLASISGDDSAVFDVFYNAPVGYGSTFDYVGLCAKSLRESLRNWVRFFPTRTNSSDLNFSETDSVGILEWIVPDYLGHRQQFTYALAAYMAGRIDRIASDEARRIRIELSVPAPAGRSDFVENNRGRIAFGQTATRFIIPRQTLNREPPAADPGLFRIVEDAAARALDDDRERTAPAREIALAIAGRLKSGDCSLNAVATELDITPNRLQKALELEGTSFRKLLDSIRRSTAERYLVDTTLSVKEIGYLLGFSETSAFSRAAKKWFGAPPRAVRNAAHRQASKST